MGAVITQPARVSDWSPRLAAWAEGRFGASFAWGETDCAMLCFEALDVLCGTAVAPQYRGRWHSVATARRFARRVITLPAALYEAGLTEVQGRPQRGDLLTIEADGWHCGYVVLGGAVLSSWVHCGVALAHAPGPQGEAGLRIWRVMSCLR